MLEYRVAFRAFVYYLVLLLLTSFFNFILSFTKFSENLFVSKYKENIKIRDSTYHQLSYYYSHAYLLLCRFVGVEIFVSNKIDTNRVLWISNHRSKFDGPLIQAFLRANNNDPVSVAKEAVSYYPIVGSFSKHIDTIFVSNNNKDSVLNNLKTNITKCNKKSILIFPEGSTMTPALMAKSKQYATENNLPVFSNLMVPRTAGYNLIREVGEYSKLGNIIIRYDSPKINDYASHSYFDLFFVFPKEIYLDISYEDITQDLNDIFVINDAILSTTINKSSYKQWGTKLSFSNIFIYAMLALTLYIPSFRYLLLFYTIIASAYNYFN